MRTALVTGSSGKVGRAVASLLQREGWTVHPFDAALGDDLRDESSVAEAVAGCDAVVHAGAVPHDSRGTPAEIMATNVLGTWHVLLGAERHGVERVVSFSSVQVFGFADGEGSPDRLPVDDDHPLRAARPYGLSKRLGEEMCAAWTGRTGIPTVVLRPVRILGEDDLRIVSPADVELGAFVHVGDVAAAVLLALRADVVGHERLILCGPGQFDTSRAAHVLGWRPTRTWPDSDGSAVAPRRDGSSGGMKSRAD